MVLVRRFARKVGRNHVDDRGDGIGQVIEGISHNSGGSAEKTDQQFDCKQNGIAQDSDDAGQFPVSTIDFRIVHILIVFDKSFDNKCSHEGPPVVNFLSVFLIDASCDKIIVSCIHDVSQLQHILQITDYWYK